MSFTCKKMSKVKPEKSYENLAKENKFVQNWLAFEKLVDYEKMKTVLSVHFEQNFDNSFAEQQNSLIHDYKKTQHLNI